MTTVHGEAKRGKISSEYRAWQSMKERCHNSNFIGYKYYGGRGIVICERWKLFERFIEDMGKKPSGSHSLDRIDNDGDYSPDNCRWATNVEQRNNMSTNVIWEFYGTKKTISEWGQIINISYNTLKRRFLLGWNIHKILTTPLRGYR